MKARLLLLACSLLLVQNSVAFIQEVQLTPKNISTSPCRVTVEDTQDGKRFRFSYRMREETKVSYHAALRIYDTDKLIAICPVEKSSADDHLNCEYVVSEKFLAKSRFHFTIAFYFPDGTQATSADQYWFYLQSFAEGK